MTTEGDGNYGLQRFLEQEGAEVDIQIVTNWLLYNVWEHTYDTKQRMNLRSHCRVRRSGSLQLLEKQAENSLGGIRLVDAAFAGEHLNNALRTSVTHVNTILNL